MVTTKEWRATNERGTRETRALEDARRERLRRERHDIAGERLEARYWLTLRRRLPRPSTRALWGAMVGERQEPRLLEVPKAESPLPWRCPPLRLRRGVVKRMSLPRGGHAPGHLREELLEGLFEDDFSEERLRFLTGRLWNCTNPAKDLEDAELARTLLREVGHGA